MGKSASMRRDAIARRPEGYLLVRSLPWGCQCVSAAEKHRV